ncbi:GNAT family N-acetyltransferase [bacterium]|nr:GNAT family N-acetyltransferase [bacterium]
MQPVTVNRDSLFVRRVYASESAQLLAFLRTLLQKAPYSSDMDDAAVLAECLQPSPPGVHPVRWLKHDLLGVWNEENLLGFADIGIGYDHTNFHLDGSRPLGLLRFLALPADYVLAGRVARLLLRELDTFWREADVGQVRAFSFSTGYPSFQCGAGMLPASWEEHMQFLSEAGYRMVERYYCLRYPLQRLLVETFPQGTYTYWPSYTEADGGFQIFDGDARVAVARIVRRQVLTPAGVNPIAYLSDLEVAPKWRRRGIGRWLVRRLINDAHLLGCRQLVLHVNHDAEAAMALFYQAGFEEINYRGYTLEKRL